MLKIQERNGIVYKQASDNLYYKHRIMLTCPCNIDPRTPHFYIVKLEFTGVYFFSYLLETYIVGTHYNRLSLCFVQKY